MIFSRFGGSLTYGNSIHYENYTISRDEFLNEAILDDVQALYRAYIIHARLQEGKGLHVEASKMGEYFWIKYDSVGKNSFTVSENIIGSKIDQSESSTNQVKQNVDAVQAISWWMIKRGKDLN